MLSSRQFGENSIPARLVILVCVVWLKSEIEIRLYGGEAKVIGAQYCALESIISEKAEGA